jgi:putative ABC transport system permease protein
VRTLDLMRFASGALRGHRLRTALSVTGVAVGIAAVVTLTALGEGARQYVVDQFAALGASLVIVMPGKVETTGGAPFGGVTHDLTLDDYRMIARLSRIRRSAPMAVATERVRFRDRGRDVPVFGTTAEFAAVRRLEIGAGSFLPAGDLDQGTNEIVLGITVANELFRGENPLGQVVRVGPWRFRVVGVLAPRGQSLTFNLDDIVLVPVRTAMRVFNRSTLFRILVDVRFRGELDLAKRDIEALIRERHRADDVTVITQDALIASFSSILNALTLALVGIASVSLAVAGVGIMNVMLVSVTERRAEIGLLKALGALDRQVLAAFLAEAVLLAFLGGLAGLGIGAGAVRAFVGVYPSFPASPPAWAVAASLALSLTVGVVFGVWPARRATRLDPVTALARR